MNLYITDLDGTLLNSSKEISNYSKEELNKLLNKGLLFTVATARTSATVVDILEGIDIKIPIILMNGVLTYDLKKKKYNNIKNIKEDTVLFIIDVLKRYNKNGFIYGIKENHLYVYHGEFTYAPEYNFYKERCDKPLKTFIKVSDYKEALDHCNIINVMVFDKLEVIKPIYEELRKLEDITCNYYEDIYERGSYFLEAYSSKASKAKAIETVSRNISHDKVICFGDNINDIPMFHMAEESYAVENAVKDLKDIATGVIGNNDEDGVVNFIKEHFKK